MPIKQFFGPTQLLVVKEYNQWEEEFVRAIAENAQVSERGSPVPGAAALYINVISIHEMKIYDGPMSFEDDTPTYISEWVLTAHYI